MIKEQNQKLLKNGSTDEILSVLENELKKRNESPFWADKVLPFSEAILRVLVPLKEQGLLFDPQGVPQDELNAELFFEWSDFLSLKTLAFTLQKSNQASELQRTKIDEKLAKKYKYIDLSLLGAYLSKYSVNLEKEHLDFPIASYNLHQGVSNVIKSLME